jgi:hypothetical protein
MICERLTVGIAIALAERLEKEGINDEKAKGIHAH